MQRPYEQRHGLRFTANLQNHQFCSFAAIHVYQATPALGFSPTPALVKTPTLGANPNW